MKNFHEIDKNRYKWDSRKIYLKLKFIISWELFNTKITKILYIRDYCKETIYNIIKDKVNLDAIDYYLTIKEIIVELEVNFDNFNKEEKADIEL